MVSQQVVEVSFRERLHFVQDCYLAVDALV
jgi:hypothetical protein